MRGKRRPTLRERSSLPSFYFQSEAESDWVRGERRPTLRERSSFLSFYF